MPSVTTDFQAAVERVLYVLIAGAIAGWGIYKRFRQEGAKPAALPGSLSEQVRIAPPDDPKTLRALLTVTDVLDDLQAQIVDFKAIVAAKDATITAQATTIETLTEQRDRGARELIAAIADAADLRGRVAELESTVAAQQTEIERLKTLLAERERNHPGGEAA